jgi:capsid protein
MGSAGAAYHHMREYLALCLPPTIQAQIEDLVANAKAAPENSSTDAALTKAKADATATAKPLMTNTGVASGTKSATTSINVH